jgi:hypothetical protein
MPTVTEKLIDALASCKNARCPGYKQETVKAVETLTEFSYIDLGGDLPGIERSTTLLRFDDLADAQCPQCGEPRLVADQVRPVYPNISGQPQDALLAVHRDAERVRDLELQSAKREAELAQMRVVMERQNGMIERLLAGQESPAPARSRAKKEIDAE